MLTASARPDTDRTSGFAGATAPRPRLVVIRRRRVLSVLLSAAAGTGLLGLISTLSVLRWAAAAFVLLAAGYLALVAHIRHLQASREMSLAFGDPGIAEFDWAQLEHGLGLAMPADDREVIAPPVEIGNKELAQFLISYATGWLLTPVVMMIRLVRGDPAVADRNGVIGRIVRLQQYGRSQSLRILTVGAAATVGITAVSGVTAGALTSPRVIASATATAGPGYTVQRGDTMVSIAARYGTTVSALTAANHVANPNLILPGQVLTIAGAGPVATLAAAAPSTSYTVVRGDTLGAIAARHGTTVAAIAAANGIANPNVIRPGQVLTIAGSSSATGMRAAAPAPSVPASGTGATYTVRSGDTLSAIAAHSGRSVAAIAAANHLANPNRILPGQILTIPNPVPTAARVSVPLAVPAAQPAPAPVPAPVAHPVAATVTAATSSGAGLPLPAQYLRGGTVDQGVDYAAPGGTPLYAMGDGVIIREGMTGFGPATPCLQITSGPLAGKSIYYGHAGPNLVHVGDHVVKGQQISIVGYGIVGYSTGPHLEIGFYPPGSSGSGQAMLDFINSVVGHSTG